MEALNASCGPGSRPNMRKRSGGGTGGKQTSMNVRCRYTTPERSSTSENARETGSGTQRIRNRQKNIGGWLYDYGGGRKDAEPLATAVPAEEDKKKACHNSTYVLEYWHSWTQRQITLLGSSSESQHPFVCCRARSPGRPLGPGRAHLRSRGSGLRVAPSDGVDHSASLELRLGLLQLRLGVEQKRRSRPHLQERVQYEGSTKHRAFEGLGERELVPCGLRGIG